MVVNDLKGSTLEWQAQDFTDESANKMLNQIPYCLGTLLYTSILFKFPANPITLVMKY